MNELPNVASEQSPAGVRHDVHVGGDWGDHRRHCRRREPRAPHRLPCRVRVFDPAEGCWVAKLGHTVNISPGGLALHVAMAVPVGARVAAVIPRFEAEPWSISGTVNHSRRVLTGAFEIGISTTDA